jgi:hypothetical protein
MDLIRILFSPEWHSLQVKPQGIQARVVSAGVRQGTAVSRLEVEGSSVADVRELFLHSQPSDFFPGASSFRRHSTPDGGQQFLENPLGGPPIMHTTISPTDQGIEGRFQGLMYGQAPLSIFEQGGKVIIEETGTIARPNLRFNPLQIAAEAVPFFGAIPRVARELTEFALGTGLAAVHAYKVRQDDGRTIARSLERHGSGQ